MRFQKCADTVLLFTQYRYYVQSVEIQNRPLFLSQVKKVKSKDRKIVQLEKSIST
jgi:hypothetical protein